MTCRIHPFIMSVMLFASLLSHAQSVEKPPDSQGAPPQAPPTFQLATVTENPILHPSFGGVGNPQCDARGNVYINETLQSNSERMILRLSSDGKQSNQLLVPSDLSKDFLSAFYVDPGGTLYALLVSPAPPFTYTLTELSSSGDEIRRTALQLPGDFSPSEVAVLPEGQIMTRGSLTLPVQSAPKGTIPVVQSFLYMAWLDANGQRIHDTGSDPKGREVYDLSKYADWAAITTGPPGTFLTVSNNSLNTYDSKGTLLHSFAIAKPEKDAIASGIQYLDGQAEVEFEVPHQVDAFPAAPDDAPHPITPDTNPHRHDKVTLLRQVWLFIDPETGTMHGFYELPDFNGSGYCYLGNQNFLYATMKNMQSVLVEARMR